MFGMQCDHGIEVQACRKIEPVEAAHDFLVVFSALWTIVGSILQIDTISDSIYWEATMVQCGRERCVALLKLGKTSMFHEVKSESLLGEVAFSVVAIVPFPMKLYAKKPLQFIVP